MLEREGYTFSVKIRHPSWIVTRFTEGMSCEPDYSWSVGEEHRTGSGILLRLRDKTYWCVSNQVEGKRRFVREFKQILKWLSTKKPFLEEVRTAGGRIAVDIGLRGSANMGDVIEPDDLRLASELGISLGIEVFPRRTPREEIRDEELPWTTIVTD